jgi:hypothetical protein
MSSNPTDITVEDVTFRVELTPQSQADKPGWIKVSLAAPVTDPRDVRTAQGVFALLAREHQYRAKSAPNAAAAPAAPEAAEAYVSSLDFPVGLVMRNLVNYLESCAAHPQKVRLAIPASAQRSR